MAAPIAQIANENKGEPLYIHYIAIRYLTRYVRELVGHKHGKPVYHTEAVPDKSGKGVLLTWCMVFHRTKEEEKAIRKENLIEDNSVDESRKWWRRS